MSHNPERKEKDCLNCGAIVQGRYCQVCGQENIIPKETFWGLVSHFFYDITHFDSKFFKTLKILIMRPGFLSKEYLQGRRVAYLHPVRMYMFVSAIFFLIFFSIENPWGIVKVNVDKVLIGEGGKSEMKETQGSLRKDTGNKKINAELAILNDSARELTQPDLQKVKSEDSIRKLSENKEYRSVSEYDSAQNRLSPSARDNWFKRAMIKRGIEVKKKYGRDPSALVEKFYETFIHKLPYLLFISLPFFAAILKLLYLRRKNFYYGDHAVFSVHHYIFSFLLLLVLLAFDGLRNITGWGFLGIIMGIVFFTGPLYLYIAMKKFYQQGWLKTVMKFLFLNILAYITIVILLAIFIFFSFFQL